MSDASDPVGTPAPSGATSWRDVYTLVQGVEERQGKALAGVETRLTQRIEEIARVAQTTADDHEVRLRVLEKSDQGRSGGDRRASSVDTTVRGWITVALMVASASLGAAGLMLAVGR